MKEYEIYVQNSKAVEKKDRADLLTDFRNEKDNERTDIPFIMPHEFLFLLCNAMNRLDIINKSHKPSLKSDSGMIYQWEISYPKRDIEGKLKADEQKLYKRFMGERKKKTLPNDKKNHLT